MTGPHGRATARAMAAQLLALPTPPTAIFAASDDQAVGVLDAAEAVGVAVPDDLSVVGFDDVEIARYVGLTTVAQPLEESGARGAELAAARARGLAGARRGVALRARVRETSAAPRRSPLQRPKSWHDARVGDNVRECQ